MNKYIKTYLELLFPSFLKKMGLSPNTIKIIRIGTLLFISILLIAVLIGNKRTKNIRIIKESDIAYFKDPGISSTWGDISSGMQGEYVSNESAERILKMKVGESIGLITKMGSFQLELINGKRTFFIDDFRTSIRIPFTYYRENCTTNPNRIGTLNVEYSGKDNGDIDLCKKLYNKTCIVSGRIKELKLKVASHACDETYATIYLEKIKIEEYNSKK